MISISSPSYLSLADCDIVDIGGDKVFLKSSLGGHLDRTLSVQSHVRCVYHADFLELQKIACVRFYWSPAAAA